VCWLVLVRAIFELRASGLWELRRLKWLISFVLSKTYRIPTSRTSCRHGGAAGGTAVVARRAGAARRRVMRRTDGRRGGSVGPPASRRPHPSPWTEGDKGATGTGVEWKQGSRRWAPAATGERKSWKPSFEPITLVFQLEPLGAETGREKPRTGPPAASGVVDIAEMSPRRVELPPVRWSGRSLCLGGEAQSAKPGGCKYRLSHESKGPQSAARF